MGEGEGEGEPLSFHYSLMMRSAPEEMRGPGWVGWACCHMPRALLVRNGPVCFSISLLLLCCSGDLRFSGEGVGLRSSGD